MLLRASAFARCQTALLPKRCAVRACSRQTAPSGDNRNRLCFVAPEESATKHLAALLAQELRAGDCYCLHGDVGAGKSAFSRGFIRAAAEDDELPVPSPSYLLQQIYDDHAGPPIHHFDFYRLDHASGVGRLDLPTSFQKAVSLLEWADKLQELPPARLEVYISLLNEQSKAQILSQCQGEDDNPASYNDEELTYEDRHWRLICLQPIGTSWLARAEVIARKVAMQQASHGLVVAE